MVNPNAFFIFSSTKIFTNIIRLFKVSYTLDVRALSLMRIAVGLVLMTDLMVRSLSINVFFTDEGVLPVSILKQYSWNPYYFSFHALSGELWWQVVLFILNAIAIFLLIIGYRARVFTFICWAFLTSLQTRNPFISQGGDDLMRLILLWGIFLPWGERYSVNKSSHISTSYFSLANVGYIFLVASVYYFSALLKTSPEWRTEGTAIYYALSLDQLRMPLGTYLYQFPQVMKVLTFIVFYIELIAPFFLVLPFMPWWVRFTGVVSLFLLHLGIVSTLYVGLFYAIGISTLIGMLPGNVMDWFERKCYKNKTKFQLIDGPEQSRLYIMFNYIRNGFFVVLIAYCLMINFGALRWFPYMLDQSVVKFGNILRLEQHWGMFSPFILKDDGFYIYEGYTKSGEKLDIKHNTPDVVYTKPSHLVTEYESDRWRKFSENYVFNNNNFMRPYYCDYLLKKWNKEHPDKPISELTIYFMKEVSLPDYQIKPLEKKAVCNCHDNDAFPR